VSAEPSSGAREPAAPGASRVALAILPLPFVATVLVPAVIVATEGENWGFDGVRRTLAGEEGVGLLLPLAVGLALIAAGAALFVWTVRLFAGRGRGTLAPWDPPKRLVVAGPYRYMRHPMIFGVALVLAGETLALGLTAIGIWLAVFVAVNAIYLPLVEEPALRRRFGPDYDRYTANVRRWLPRLRPWNKE
jgi:protein-S-isoprenylcysteine O-methyltransferase Ste14